MGTRADFYLGRGEDAQWLASIAWDGHPAAISMKVLSATTDEEFKSALMEFFVGRYDVSHPDTGWPWPWPNSQTTDYAYALDEGKVWASGFGYEWFDPLDPDSDENYQKGDKVPFPDMTKVQNVTFGKRSGLIIVNATITNMADKEDQ